MGRRDDVGTLIFEPRSSAGSYSLSLSGTSSISMGTDELAAWEAYFCIVRKSVIDTFNVSRMGDT